MDLWIMYKLASVVLFENAERLGLIWKYEEQWVSYMNACILIKCIFAVTISFAEKTFQRIKLLSHTLEEAASNAQNDAEHACIIFCFHLLLLLTLSLLAFFWNSDKLFTNSIACADGHGVSLRTNVARLPRDFFK